MCSARGAKVTSFPVSLRLSSFLDKVVLPSEGGARRGERKAEVMSPGTELQRGAPKAVLGYTPDEKLRLQQLRDLRRRWLKDQELSPREPVLPPRKPGLVEGFWERFLQPGGLWRKQVFKTYNAGTFLVVRLLIPLWVAHYYVKYHLLMQPYGIVESKRSIFPGDTILETGEVIPPLEIPSSHH